MKRAALMITAKYFGYIVWSKSYKGMHFTLSLASATEWLVCYPEGEAIVVHRGKVI